MKHLSFWHKLLYGSGDWGLASTGMLRSVFYAIYLTDVVGLDARIGSFAALAKFLAMQLFDRMGAIFMHT